MSSLSPYRPMKERDETDDFAEWDENRLAKFFSKRGLGRYADTLRKHRITGKLGSLHPFWA